MKIVPKLSIVLLLAGCASAPSTSGSPPPAQGEVCPETKVFGSMQQMRSGDLSTQVELSELEWSRNTVALGATTDKQMEITAADGELALVGPSEVRSPVRHKEPSTQSATFLVYASPSEWREVGAVAASDIDGVLDAVDTARRESSCAESDVVPFRARARASSVTWSTVGQPRGYEQTDTDVDVILVGFWAPSRQGEFVPNGLAGHVHVLVPILETDSDQPRVNWFGGHLRSIEIDGEVQLELPAPSAAPEEG